MLMENALKANTALFNMINAQQCTGAEDGEHVKRKLLVFNDVFQALTDST